MENAASYSRFDQALKTFRKRRRLTQQQLADLAGLHRQTIGNWERGRLPPDKHSVLRVARALRLNDGEARQLLEACLTIPAPLWVVPYPRNPLFTGREETFATLHALLACEGRVALTSFALSGLGGIGKTQLALEYAYRHALDYSAVLWVSAETSETIMSSFGAIAESLALPERGEAGQQQLWAAVQRWLNAHSGWLMIWDNVEDLALVSRYLTTLQGMHLMTARLQAVGTLAQGIELLPLPADDALLFLLRRAKRLPPDATHRQLATLARQEPAEHKAAKALVRLLDGLPLALDQAGAYIEEVRCSLAAYLKRYRSQRGRLLARRGTSAGHPESVAATFRLALSRLEHTPTATDLLRLCAFLAPDAIPEELLTAGGVDLGAALNVVATDEFALDDALAPLLRLSLVQRLPETDTFSIHRLVQAVQQECLSEADQRLWAERAVRLVAAAFPDSNDFATWERCQQLVSHALVCARHIKRWDFTFPEAATLLNDAGHYLRQRVQPKEALLLLEQVVKIRQQTLGHTHHNTATSINNLAAVYWTLGQHRKALPLFEEALAIREQVLDSNHPDVARSLNNVAMLHGTLGEYQEAISYYLRALPILEQTLGPNHQDVATILHNLADLYCIQAQHREALPRHQRALEIREQALGKEHPDVAYSLDAMAEIYGVEGAYEQARTLYERSLEIRENAWKNGHPDIALSLTGLAVVYQRLGDVEKALEYHQRALKIRKQKLGDEHPDTAGSQKYLADIYTQQGQYAQAESSYQQALAVYEQHLGFDHPLTAVALAGLATLCVQRGNLEEAHALYARALDIQEQRLGNKHPDTIKTRRQLMESRPPGVRATPSRRKPADRG